MSQVKIEWVSVGTRGEIITGEGPSEIITANTTVQANSTTATTYIARVTALDTAAYVLAAANPVTTNLNSVLAKPGVPQLFSIQPGQKFAVLQATGAEAGLGSGSEVTVTGNVTVNPVTIAGTVTANPTSATPFLANALSTTPATVVGTAAVLTSYYVFNPGAATAYVQIFDVAAATPVTLGTTVPKWSIGIPAGGGANLTGLALNFTNGIKVAATTTATGLTAPATALDANFGYR